MQIITIFNGFFGYIIFLFFIFENEAKGEDLFNMLFEKMFKGLFRLLFWMYYFKMIVSKYLFV